MSKSKPKGNGETNEEKYLRALRDISDLLRRSGIHLHDHTLLSNALLISETAPNPKQKEWEILC